MGSELGGIENARFIPPDPLCVPALMDNWTAYLASTEKDPIVQAAIIHAQFEIIHPFCDGNGRLGRMLLPLFFFSKGVLPAPMFYLSRYLERFETEYKNALLGITANGDWTSWVRFFARAVTAQAEENLAISEKIQTYYRDTKKRILENTRSQHAISLWDAIVSTPVFRISSLKLLKAPSRIALMQLVTQFEKMGIIHRIEPAAGRKGALYVCAPLVNIPEQKEIF
ncbi:MAG: Fic family protein [Verrucomicrobia bacterium]|nr:Fic family protein [Verrucomicrobiota bacterium]